YDPLRELPAERSHAFLPGMVDAARTGPPDSQAGPARANDEGRLPQGREGRRDQELVLLTHRPDAGLRRPQAVLPRFLTDAVALVRVLVDPDVHELVEPTELARPAGGQRRELLPARHGLAPRFQHLREIARRVGVDAHLVEVAGAVVTAAQGLHERRGNHDVGLLLDDQIAATGQGRERLV